LALSFPSLAEESPLSISVGMKNLQIDMHGYEANNRELIVVETALDAIYVNASYYQTSSISYSIEYASFSSSETVINNSGSIIFDVTAEGDFISEESSSEFEVQVNPTNYLSIYSQYTFRIKDTVRPYLLAGLSHISADIKHSYVETKNDITVANEKFSISESSKGLMYGAGLDIKVYNKISFIFDYRVHQDIADQATNEINAAFKYRF
jgi:opacity protein-like surface antigen